MRIHFKQIGEGEPLVVLHGLFGQSDNWFGVAPKLAEKFRVLVPDLRNHGNSPHHPEMDYPLMAADVDAFFVGQKIESAFVVGHSMGGKVAMQLALEFPARVKKLVVADISPRAYEPAHDKILAALLALDLPMFQSRQQIENALAAEIPDLTLRRFLLKNLGRNEAGDFKWKINLSGLAENYPRLREALHFEIPFNKPALFIRGGRSQYVSETDMPKIFRLFPSAKIRTIETAGHWVHADAPEEFVQHILEFL